MSLVTSRFAADADADEPSTASPWRERSAGAQPILLSTSPGFGIGAAGPVLGPGSRYRVLKVMGGVAEVEVDAAGERQIGYCPLMLIGGPAALATGRHRPTPAALGVMLLLIAAIGVVALAL